MNFNENLYRIRKEKGLSQEDLAVLCNVSRQAISKWENGSANPDMNNLTTLAHCLNVSTDELLGNSTSNQDTVNSQYEDYRYIRIKRLRNYEYRSNLKLGNLPLVHINFGRFRNDDGKIRVAKGIIAIGNISIGLFSLGFISLGIISIGLLSIAILCAISTLAIAYFAIGTISIGYISMGAIAIGIYSIGAIAIGYEVALGAVSYGNVAIGIYTSGHMKYHLQNHNTCLLDQNEFMQLKQYLSNTSLPKLMEIFLKSIPKC